MSIPSDDYYTREKQIDRLRLLLASQPLTVITLDGGGFTGQSIQLAEAVTLGRGEVAFILELLDVQADQPVTVSHTVSAT